MFCKKNGMFEKFLFTQRIKIESTPLMIAILFFLPFFSYNNKTKLLNQFKNDIYISFFLLKLAPILVNSSKMFTKI